MNPRRRPWQGRTLPLSYSRRGETLFTQGFDHVSRLVPSGARLDPRSFARDQFDRVIFQAVNVAVPGQNEANQGACAICLLRSSGTGYVSSQEYDQLEPDPDFISRRVPPFVRADRPNRSPAPQSRCCRPSGGCPSTGSHGFLRYAVLLLETTPACCRPVFEEA